jgi:hypothetical protein
MVSRCPSSEMLPISSPRFAGVRRSSHHSPRLTLSIVVAFLLGSVIPHDLRGRNGRPIVFQAQSNHSGIVFSSLRAVDADLHQESDEQIRALFLRYCLFFCLLHVEDPQTIVVLQQRDSDTWWSTILGALCLKESNSSRNWSAYSLGRVLYICGAKISKTLLNEPWDHSQEDITPAELRLIYSDLFAVELGEPKTFGTSQQQRINVILKHSELFRDTPLPNTMEWYEAITSNIPIFLPAWSEVWQPTSS